MCRFTFYKGFPTSLNELIIEPEHSLIHQSYNSKERIEPLNGDGFGVGWYLPHILEPAVFRSTTPAWNDQNLTELSRVIHSGCILAHIRAATFGTAVMRSNCHPFKINNFMFCHNGYITDFHKIKRYILNDLSDELFNSIHGTTDSEYFFALYMNNLQKTDDINNIQNMADSLKLSLEQIAKYVKKHADDAYCALNCVVTNGLSSVICRYNSQKKGKSESLYMCKDKQYICDHGISQLKESKDTVHKCVIISSEPLSQDKCWQKIPDHTILAIHHDLKVDTIDI